MLKVAWSAAGENTRLISGVETLAVSFENIKKMDMKKALLTKG